METLMDTLMQSAYAPDQSTAQNEDQNPSQEPRPQSPNPFPKNGWRAEDVKKCLGYTDDQYTALYSKVEEAMRQAELLETSLTGERKVKLFRLLDDVLPHSDAPDVPDFLRLKAFHQLAIRINHNVKTRAGHIHHRKRERPPPQADSSPVANVENAQVGSGSQQVPSTPGMPYPNPPPFLTPPYRAPNPLGWPMPQSEGHVNGLSNHTDIGNIVLYCERQDKSQSVCSVKNLAPNNTPPGAPTDINNLTLGPWKSILVKDGVMRSPNDLITWHWGERRVKVSNDRVFRLVIEFMANHGGFIDFGVEAAKGANGVQKA